MLLRRGPGRDGRVEVSLESSIVHDATPRTGSERSGVLGEGEAREPVRFFLADEPDLDELKDLDPDREPAAFSSGERTWIGQTYARLRAAGYPVELVGRPPERGIVVFHAKHKHALAGLVPARSDLVFVATRADNSAPLLADFEVLQNGRFADDRRRFFVPHWPQPGIRARDPGRGSTVRRVGYMGLVENLHPAFRRDGWRSAVADLGLEWVPRMARSRETPRIPAVGWEDYSDLDVVVAVRPDERRLRFAKPASKLINAWYARVPAIIGVDYACREIRRGEEDYFEVCGTADALAALRRLRDDPELYARMVANGARRAGEFSVDTIVERWARLLFEVLPDRIASGGLPWSRRLPVPLRLPFRRVARVLGASRSK